VDFVFDSNDYMYVCKL